MTDINQLKHLILDMDGVLWRGNTPIDGLADFFDTLNHQGIRFMLATNNAGKTPDQYVQKLGGFGVTITAEQVMSSALATASFLSHEYNPAETTVYAVGGDGIRQALREAGFNLLERQDDTTKTDIVTVGLTTDVTYEDFSCATLHIRRGARFIGCNPDATYPSERGLLPGNGSLLALIQTATEQEPTVIGKPGPIMFQECLRRFGDEATGDNTAMVGDRLTTDILGGRNAGLQTILVLTGVSTPADLETSDIQPTYICQDINEIAAMLTS